MGETARNKPNRYGWRSLLAAPLISACFAASLGAPTPALASDLLVNSGGAMARIKVASMVERKFSTVVRQQYDFSCGSAALATLLTHHYQRPTTETDAFQAMWDVGDQNRIRELGFSLLEMKRYLESINLKADGFSLTLDRVQEIGVPGIALVDVRGYKHFVVVKGITDRVVLVGDPSTGVTSMPRHIFEERWDGTILFIRSEVLVGKANFNRVADWRLTPTSPYDRARDDESLQSLHLHQTRPSFSGISIGTLVESP
ncbi:C39 family peptidase [Hyphococcus flavus]|uniref:C39 family peptidase n=1 Tax=Hyphococcus flavus TaxID=1866326 RepID=A0AAF0CBP3_9PROT|nr:C39 family peptidase [Hyphococcus flavus]WDI31495.1 C39 family peptidase [Hyphococcus flavus]